MCEWRLESVCMCSAALLLYQRCQQPNKTCAVIQRKERTTCWWQDNNTTDGLISPLHLPAKSRAPSPPPLYTHTHTHISEWAIIAPLISICSMLLMQGRPIDTLQKGGQYYYNRKEIYFLIIM